MPLYDYKCPECGYEKEVQHPMSEIGKIEILCDHCGAPMKKMMSAPALLGFDNIGRSISKKNKHNGKSPGNKKKKSVSKPAAGKKEN